MPAGKHTSIRVAIAVPPKLHEQLSKWAEYEGRPIASLCMYLIENSLRQAQKDGIAPSIGSEERGTEDPIDRYEFTGSRHVKRTDSMNDEEFIAYYMDTYKDLENSEEPSLEDMERLNSIRARQGSFDKTFTGDDLEKIMDGYKRVQVARKVETKNNNKKEQLIEKLLNALAD